MSTELMGLLFWALVLFFLGVLASFIAAFMGLFKNKNLKDKPLSDRERRESEEFEELTRVAKKQLVQAYEDIANIPPLEEVQARQRAIKTEKKGNTFFDKFKASRATRKQAPDSQATPAIKSLKGRKV